MFSYFEFSKYIVVLCKQNLLKNEETKKLLDEDKILFTLSVGSLLSEHYDPIYQTLGLKIYLLLLKNCVSINTRNFHPLAKPYNHFRTGKFCSSSTYTKSFMMWSSN